MKSKDQTLLEEAYELVQLNEGMEDIENVKQDLKRAFSSGSFDLTSGTSRRAVSMFWLIISKAPTDEEAANIFKDISREVGGEDNKSFRFAIGDVAKELIKVSPKFKEIFSTAVNRIKRKLS